MPELTEDTQWRITEVLEPTTKPFFINEERGIRLYQGDALAMLRQSRSEKFDVIFAGPPCLLSNSGITCQSGRRN